MEIRDMLKQRRIELNLTMKELADKVGVSEGTISRWESGNIANMRRNLVKAYAKALDISPSIIMGWEDSDPEETFPEKHGSDSEAPDFEISDFEKKLVFAFRKSDVQDAVCRLLNLDYSELIN